jgi:hypothetical protein
MRTLPELYSTRTPNSVSGSHQGLAVLIQKKQKLPYGADHLRVAMPGRYRRILADFNFKLVHFGRSEVSALRCQIFHSTPANHWIALRWPAGMKNWWGVKDSNLGPTD